MPMDRVRAGESGGAPARVRGLLAAEIAAIALLAIAAWLGAPEQVGTFGQTGRPVSCGSVWGLPGTDDLNAATCTDALRTRVVAVGSLVALAGALGFGAPVVLRSGRAWSTRRRMALSAAVALPLALGVVFVLVGRHMIWSVGGA